MILASHSGFPAAVQFIMISAVIVIALASAFFQNRRRDERRIALQILADRLKFDSFNPGRDYNFILGWGFLKRLAEGEDRYAFNVLRGTYHDRPLYVFDFHYRIGAGKNEQHHYCTMLMLVMNEAFPQLVIRPEHFGERLASALGLTGDIQFESAEFSRTFSVHCTDKKFAYDVCNPQMMAYLLDNPDLHVEIQGPVICMAFEPQLPVEKIEFNLQRLAQIRSLMPEYLFTNA
jgi:hypothetical protein